MSERVDHCPVCERPMEHSLIYQHIRSTHDGIQERGGQEPPIDLGYYSYADFAVEQRGEYGQYDRPNRISEQPITTKEDN